MASLTGGLRCDATIFYHKSACQSPTGRHLQANNHHAAHPVDLTSLGVLTQQVTIGIQRDVGVLAGTKGNLAELL